MLEVLAVVASWAVMAAVVGVATLAYSRRERRQALALEAAHEPSLVVLQRVVVNLKSGTAVTGVVTTENPDRLVLKSAAVIEPGASAPVPADGAILVDRDHIDYIQAP
ncbi:hypothetical protein [Williamsia sp. D3]|uniref:hypothetical protein n=1 Tax=Williamsia sp. D3 TaxID=1313067 RepID=UPI0003D3647E|nr:hypothetical protein [Williamsia sp. D3]ETD31250.1 hypothetical protein W823_19235 [Williamsia sp. D3]